MNSAAAAHRNHNVSDVVGTFFGTAAVMVGMQKTGEVAFKRQLYQSMIAQLLLMKVTIESYRSSNSWGTIFWQYNDIWSTGSWGSVSHWRDCRSAARTPPPRTPPPLPLVGVSIGIKREVSPK